MDVIYQNFINALINQSVALRSAYEKILEYWRPDEPPITTLFAALGDRIAENFEITEPDVNKRIFELIESGMASGDQRLITAVATGLIEALISMMASKEKDLTKLMQALGGLSRKHAKAWMGQ